MTRLLRIEGADEWTLGVLYVAVVQAVLLYGLETWVISPLIGSTLGGFHHIVTYRLRGSNCGGDLMVNFFDLY